MKPVGITGPVDVSAKVLSLSFQPVGLTNQLLDGNAVSTLHEDGGKQRPRRDDHVSLVTSNNLEHQVFYQQCLGRVQTVYVPETIRYYFNVCSKADMSELNLPHATHTHTPV